MADDVNIVVRVRDATRVGISEVNARLTTLVRTASTMDKSFGSAKGAAISLAPALIPIAAATAPIAAGLGAATIAVGAFGAALGPQIMAMSEATEAEKKYQDAVDEHGATSKEATAAQAAYAKEMAKLPPATRAAAAQLSVLKDGYKDWSAALADDTMPVVTKSLATFGAIFPKLTPTVKGASQELDRFVTIAAGGVQSAAFDRFMKSFSDFSTDTLAKANDGLLKLVSTTETGEIGGNLREFMDYARENGPLVGETLGNLGDVMMKLLVAASDVGVGMLQVINAFASLVNAVPAGLITTLLQVAIAFKAIKIAGAGFAALGVGIQALTVQIIAMRTAATTAGGGMAGLTAAIGAMSRTAKMAAAATGIGLLIVGLMELSRLGRGAPADVDKMTSAIGEFGKTGKVGGEAARVLGADLGELEQSLRTLARPSTRESVQQWITQLAGMDSTPVKVAKEQIDAVDQAVAQLVKNGNADLAEAAIRRFGKSLGNLSEGELRNELDAYDEAIAATKFEAELAADAMGLFGQQALEVQGKLDAQKQSIAGLQQSVHALNQTYLQSRGDVRAMEAAIDAATETINKNGRTLDENTAAGRDNAAALDAIASTTMKAMEAKYMETGSWEEAMKVYQRGRGALDQSTAATAKNEAAAKALADQLLSTPKETTAHLRGNMRDLQKKLDSAKSQLKRVPDSRKAEIRGQIKQLEREVAAAKALLRSIPDELVNVTVNRHVRTINYAGVSAGTARSGLATGGIVGAAGGGPRSRMTLVGEQGPELVDLAPGSRVRSNPDTRRMFASAGRGGGGPIVIQLDIAGRYLGEVVIDPLRKEIHARGGNVQAVLGRRGA